MRNVALFLTGLTAVALGVFIAWRGGDWVYRQAVTENPKFNLEYLEIQTDGVISREQLRHWAGVKVGDNLFAVDLARVQRDLELVPAIQAAIVERVLPRTLRIRVVEREPIAQVVFVRPHEDGPAARGVYLLDVQGYAMFPLGAHQRAVPARTNEVLPTLTGMRMHDLCPGRRVELPQVQAALRLLDALPRSPMATLADLRQIDVGQPNLLLALTGQGSEITFGLNHPETQLRRWRAIADFGHRAGRQVASLDLSVSNNVPARWTEAGLTPPPAPPAPPPSPYRRRHV
jgi:hypothetical protein